MAYTKEEFRKAQNRLDRSNQVHNMLRDRHLNTWKKTGNIRFLILHEYHRDMYHEQDRVNRILSPKEKKEVFRKAKNWIEHQ